VEYENFNVKHFFVEEKELTVAVRVLRCKLSTWSQVATDHSFDFPKLIIL
jgi:hypothetical protein